MKVPPCMLVVLMAVVMTFSAQVASTDAKAGLLRYADEHDDGAGPFGSLEDAADDTKRPCVDSGVTGCVYPEVCEAQWNSHTGWTFKGCRTPETGRLRMPAGRGSANTRTSTTESETDDKVDEDNSDPLDVHTDDGGNRYVVLPDGSRRYIVDDTDDDTQTKATSPSFNATMVTPGDFTLLGEGVCRGWDKDASQVPDGAIVKEKGVPYVQCFQGCRDMGWACTGIDYVREGLICTTYQFVIDEAKPVSAGKAARCFKYTPHT
ncbi:unnamed protein product [Vitrella brassicaformis CCMP3155]|uniref:Apple domain-containing protein n=1 Tax=Vitrella brassicaformis (strain CCMP3155) TaxID=1169540 RepID=A0A0G4H447_VITBC|nr:unnamed protein product [Vitrella brassicaformis CCMP3155]|eukprot:CEM38524.1 unnamed protein product [Vitrella brassicaformis CCMP3155]